MLNDNHDKLIACPPTVIIGNQRSGTTVLHQFLGRSQDFEDFGEVFNWNDKDANDPHNYFIYATEHAEAIFGDHIEMSDAFLEYLAYLSRLSSLPRYVIDIKYNSWNHFNPVFHHISEEPLMLKALKEIGARIIHMRRRNLLNQYLSAAIARARQKWLYREGEAVDGNLSVRIDLDDCLEFMGNSSRSAKLFDQWLDGYEFRLNAVYEDAYESCYLTENFKSNLEALLRPSTPLNGKLPHVKTPVSKYEAVANFDDVVHAVSAHAPFAWMADELRENARAIEAVDPAEREIASCEDTRTQVRDSCDSRQCDACASCQNRRRVEREFARS